MRKTRVTDNRIVNAGGHGIPVGTRVDRLKRQLGFSRVGLAWHVLRGRPLFYGAGFRIEGTLHLTDRNMRVVGTTRRGAA